MIYKRFLTACLLLAVTVASAQQPPPGPPPGSLAGPMPGPAAEPAPAPARTGAARGVSLNKVVAIVGDGVVLQSSLDQQVQMVTNRLTQAGQQQPPAELLRQQVLERLILQEIQAQRADRAGIKVSDEQLNQTLTEVAARNNVKFADLPAALEGTPARSTCRTPGPTCRTWRAPSWWWPRAAVKGRSACTSPATR